MPAGSGLVELNVPGTQSLDQQVGGEAGDDLAYQLDKQDIQDVCVFIAVLNRRPQLRYDVAVKQVASAAQLVSWSRRFWDWRGRGDFITVTFRCVAGLEDRL